MKTLIAIAILSTLSGCAANTELVAQRREAHNTLAKDLLDKDNAKVDKEFDAKREEVQRQKDLALAVMDETDPYGEETKMRIKAAEHCQKEVAEKGPAHPHYHLCISTTGLAESAKTRDHEHIQQLKTDLAKDYDKQLAKIESDRAADKQMYQRIYASNLIEEPSVKRTYAGGYAGSAAMAPINSNPYNTPSPSLYMQPGPGTSIQTFGGDMWSGRSTTPSGRGYTCFGAYGNVSCY